MHLRLTYLTLFICCSLPTRAQNVTPVGLITEANDARIRRDGARVDTPTYPGDLLFAGDVVFTQTGSFTFSFCPGLLAYSVGRGEVQIESNRVRSERSEVRATKQLTACALPAVTPNAQNDLRLYADTIQNELAPGRNAQAPGTQPAVRNGSELEAIDAALKEDSGNLTLRVARAAILEKNGQLGDAAREYQEIAGTIPKTHWSGEKAQTLRALYERSGVAGGRTIGVIVGISRYCSLPPNLQLQYADADAQAFYDFLTTPRGGGAAKDVVLLLNEKATRSAIRTAIATTFGNANPGDNAVIFFAGHGVAMDQGPNRGAYILATDSDLQDLKTTAVPMEELQALMDGQLRPRNIRMFIDACHSGAIGSIINRDFTNDKFNRDLQMVVEHNSPSEIFGFMASRQQESSYECANVRHGAFTYFLLRGLTTDEAADDQTRHITADSLIEYVHSGVRQMTNRNQNPEPKGNFHNEDEIANPALPAPVFLNTADVPRSCIGSRGILAAALATEHSVGNSGSPQQSLPDDAFETAMRNNVILPGLPGSAFDLLMKARNSAQPSQYIQNRNRLLVALESSGQQIILQYLKGEAVPQTRDDFFRGEQLFEAALQLLPDDASVQSRHSFFRGRRLVFDHQYAPAAAALEDAIRLDPTGAYSYNALGIAALETAHYPRAVQAFQDAIRLAPYWAYARHNLALALTQAGQYSDAIKTYRAAMDLRPQYAYIPYNLGLLFERLNRPEEARQAWHESLTLSPRLARAWNAIGLSFFLEKRFALARQAYGTALPLATQQTDRLAIRHDWALLLESEGETAQAVQLWRSNLAEKPDDVPSLVGLSQAFTSEAQTGPALNALSALVAARPDYLGARLQYAKALLAAGRSNDAMHQLDLAVPYAPDNGDILEQIADLYERAGDGAGRALAIYRRALETSLSNKQRNRIRLKIQQLAGEKSQASSR